MKTVVINNCSRLEICQLQPKQKDPMGVAIAGGILTLLPGVNLVPSVEFQESIKNPLWSQKFKTKIEQSKAPEQDPDTVGKPMLEVAKWLGEKGSGEVDDKAPLAKLSPEQCQRLINETLTSDLLRSWKQEDLRPDILRAIDVQLDKIRTGDISNAASAGR